MRRFITGYEGKHPVYFSSDGIFDGKWRMYREEDIPSPVTIYGKNLALCENLVKKHVKNYCIIRPLYLWFFW